MTETSRPIAGRLLMMTRSACATTGSRQLRTGIPVTSFTFVLSQGTVTVHSPRTRQLTISCRTVPTNMAASSEWHSDRQIYLLSPHVMRRAGDIVYCMWVTNKIDEVWQQISRTAVVETVRNFAVARGGVNIPYHPYR